MQEDLEAEFQSLFSLLEELKEGMLMKIKQDRASRTYELQVCVWGFPQTPAQSPSPTAPLRLNRAQLVSCLPPNLLFLLPFLEMPPNVPSVQSQTPWCGWPHLLFPWSLAYTLHGHDPSNPPSTCSPS